MPTCIPSTWNSTLATPTLSVAVAVSVSAPVRPAARLTGAVSVATGACESPAAAATVTAATGLAAEARPRLSVATTVRLCTSAVLGVQARVNGRTSTSPIFVVPSKNSTLVTLPSLSVAVAVRVTATPTVPVGGAFNVAVGALLAGAGPESPPQASSNIDAAKAATA